MTDRGPAPPAASAPDHPPDLLPEIPLEFPFDPPDRNGGVVEVAPGILWARIPMPMRLDHINVYLLRDGDGWMAVDTGLNLDASKAAWERLAAERLDGLPLKGLVCTHFHYDHAGLAGWMMERFGIPLHMTHGEFYIMRALVGPLPDPPPAPMPVFFRRAGMPQERIDALIRSLQRDRLGSAPPDSFVRLRDGDVLPIGGRRWRVVVGEGHSPEHACLYCAEDRLLISGDQLLPRISSNVMVSSVEPEGDPLRLWLDSLDRLDRLAPDTLVLPSHERAFRGIHRRVQQLRDHHEQQIALLRDHIAATGPCTAYEAMAAQFPRALGPMDEMLAIGETIAHLSLMRHRGLLRRTLDDQGIHRFALAD